MAIFSLSFSMEPGNCVQNDATAFCQAICPCDLMALRYWYYTVTPKLCIQAFDILIHSIWIHLRHVLSECIQVFCNSETRLDYDILHTIFSFLDVFIFYAFLSEGFTSLTTSWNQIQWSYQFSISIYMFIHKQNWISKESNRVCFNNSNSNLCSGNWNWKVTPLILR